MSWVLALKPKQRRKKERFLICHLTTTSDAIQPLTQKRLTIWPQHTSCVSDWRRQVELCIDQVVYTHSTGTRVQVFLCYVTKQRVLQQVLHNFRELAAGPSPQLVSQSRSLGLASTSSQGSSQG